MNSQVDLILTFLISQMNILEIIKLCNGWQY